MLMEAKENSWETYVEEYLLQTTRRRSRNEKSRQSLLHQSNPGDSVSSAQAIAAVAMDNMGSALTDKMQARLSSSGSKAQSQSQQEKLDRDYLAKKERASRSRSRVEEQRKTARSSLSENIGSGIRSNGIRSYESSRYTFQSLSYFGCLYTPRHHEVEFRQHFVDSFLSASRSSLNPPGPFIASICGKEKRTIWF